MDSQTILLEKNFDLMSLLCTKHIRQLETTQR